MTTTTEPTGGHLIDEAKKLGAVSMSEERQYEVIINDNGTSSIKYLGFGPIHEAVKVEEEVRATWQRVSAPPIPQYEPPPQDTAPAPSPSSDNGAAICPDHNTAMNTNSRGWYCPTKTGPGPKDWCERTRPA
mgnify:FL=1